MKNFGKNLVIVLVSILAACTNEGVVEENTELSSCVEKGIYTFIYHGKSYSSEYVILPDSTCLFENKEVADLMDHYRFASNVAVLALNDGLYEYFDSEEELNDSLSVRPQIRN